MSSSVHINKKKKDILILGKGLTGDLVDTTLTAEKKYSTNFTEQQKKFYLKVVSTTFLLVCFLSLNESTCQKCFLSHFKSSFCSRENQFLVF